MWYHVIAEAHLEKILTFFHSRLVWVSKNRIWNLNFEPVFPIDQKVNAKLSQIKINLYFSYRNSYYVSDHTCVNTFLKVIKQGQFYFCCAINRCLYRSNSKVLKPKYYDHKCLIIFNTKVKSFDGKVYICKIWNLQVSKSQVS